MLGVCRIFGKRPDGETYLAGVIDLNTQKFISCDQDKLDEIRKSVHENISQKINEMLEQDPTIPFVYKEDSENSAVI